MKKLNFKYIFLIYSAFMPNITYSYYANNSSTGLVVQSFKKRNQNNQIVQVPIKVDNLNIINNNQNHYQENSNPSVVQESNKQRIILIHVPNEENDSEFYQLNNSQTFQSPYDTIENNQNFSNHLNNHYLHNNVTGFIRPINAQINSPFGIRFHPIKKRYIFHTGVDFAAPIGTPIRAVADGIVTYAAPKGGYGNTVMIKHTEHTQNIDEWGTLYGHTSKILVQQGQRVKQGQIIALVGATGLATGPHLHFEVLQNGKKINPVNFIPAKQ